jgi:hypothetical protein
MKYLVFIIGYLFLANVTLYAQNNTVTIKGRVLDIGDNALNDVNVNVRNTNISTTTNSKGEFTIQAPAKKNTNIDFSFSGFEKYTYNLNTETATKFNITVLLKSKVKLIRTTVITDKSKRGDAGNIRLNPKMYENNPSINGGIEDLLKIALSGNNNEMTSQYKVRGGNFDENLVYINDFEVYRPFLVKSGQQEGLSIINPDLVGGVNFSAGGFQAKYGDKMSSVLDITYKRPKEFGGRFSISSLGATLHLEGRAKNNRLTYAIGARQKSNKYLLQAQQTKGVYNPSFTDFQTYINYQFNDNWQMDVFLNYARNRFDFIPETQTQSFGLLNKAFQLETFFDGVELDKFDSRYGGISVSNTPNNHTLYKFIASGFQTNEIETYDIIGAYRLGELETDLGKETFGNVKSYLGAGEIQNFARNYLKVNVGNIGHKGALDKGKHYIQWGANAEFISIKDKLNEWERRDSAGFSQPVNPNALTIFRKYKSSQDFVYNRFTGYVQDNISLDSIGVIITGGIRFNYNQLNNEFLVSPRLQLSYKPLWEKDIVFRGAFGYYMQPVFYREMRNLDGIVNKEVKAQKSAHYVAGLDYNFKAFKNRPFKFTTEVYYKNMWDLIPYEIDNVRIRYFGKNNAKGYATGAEFRLYGDIVKDAESWISVGIMKTQEDVLDDYIQYVKTDGTDSTRTFPGYIPRPTDSRLSFGLFFSDYLPRNKNFKVHINGLYGTGLPFGPPDNTRYADTLRIPSYKRVDIGFSALLIDGETAKPRYSFFRHVKSQWLSLEVFNLLGIGNTISYLWVQDLTSNRTYAVPNRLTSRLLNVKLVTKF